MTDTVWAVIRGSADLATFASAVGAVPGVAELLDSPTATTVLALSDDVFGALPEPLIRELLSDPDRHAEFIRRHLADVGGLGPIMRMLDGSTVVVGGSTDAPTFDGVRCRPGPWTAVNGTVFVLDEALPTEGS